LLEVGSGGAPFREELDGAAKHVTTLDIVDRYGTRDIIADVQSMPGVPDSNFDTVLCTQVLEHLEDPCGALREMRRVLRDDGILILSVPHLSMIHEAPEDYFRFTDYGLRSLCEKANFEPISSSRPED
jgi:ubiquinone/menaquinone biosynthesis C-methylase UbiE